MRRAEPSQCDRRHYYCSEVPPDPSQAAVAVAIAQLTLDAVTTAGGALSRRREQKRRSGFDEMLATQSERVAGLLDERFGAELQAAILATTATVDFREIVEIHAYSARLGGEQQLHLLSDLYRRHFNLYTRVGVDGADATRQLMHAAILHLLEQPQYSSAPSQGDPGTALLARLLDNLSRKLTDTANWTSEDEKRLRDTLRLHRNQMRGVVGRIRPPDLASRTLLPIEQIYVAPALSGAFSEPIELSTAIRDRRLSPTVVLGDPGAGKTTMSYFIAKMRCSLEITTQSRLFV